MDMFSFLLLAHLISAVIGVGSATFLEIFLNKSLLDGEIDPTERSFIKTTTTVLRIGLLASLFTGLGLILFYRFNDQIFRLYDPLLWAKFTVIFILLINAVMLHAHKISLKLGSTISFVSWWSAFILGFLASGPAIPYTILLFYYLLALALGYLVLNGIRRMLGIKL